jgi:2-dehydro-3-deoxyphosphogluconate aldolase/(4S)-4-hydroxy-2-oxoglutarate aldolase
MTRATEAAENRVLAQLGKGRIAALVSLDAPAQVVAAGSALLRGGVTCVELERPTVGLLRDARRVDGLLVGAGNVRSVAQAEEAVRGGAHFATAPATNMEVVLACRELELPFFPGAATPTEIERLALVGVRTIRLFPAAALGGPELLRSVAAMDPHLRFMPGGGLGPETLRSYLSVDAVLAVAVGGLIREELLRAQNYERIEWLARDATRALAPQRVRGGR